MRTSRAFTIIELIFVIVVLGILASVALPKFASTGTNARVASGKADVSAIRSAIMAERQKGIIKGQSAYIENGTGTDADGNKQLNNGGLFGGVLTYPKQNSNTDGNWYTTNTANGNFSYIIDGTSVSFDYNATTGTFTCNPTSGTADQKKYCKKLIY
jgi:general secretion pathway protein G